MKLYSLPLSTYSAKTRIIIYEKDVDIEIVEPPGGLDSDQYLSINPLGQIPTLEVNGTRIPESEVINEYLEEEFPDPPLLPESSLQRAQTRLLSRFHDLYFQPNISNILYEFVYEGSPDLEIVDNNLESFLKRLEQLEHFLIPGPWMAGETFSLADAAFVPTIFQVQNLLPEFEIEVDLDEHPPLTVWWDQVQKRESCEQVLNEMDEGLKELVE